LPFHSFGQAWGGGGIPTSQDLSARPGRMPARRPLMPQWLQAKNLICVQRVVPMLVDDSITLKHNPTLIFAFGVAQGQLGTFLDTDPEKFAHVHFRFGTPSLTRNIFPLTHYAKIPKLLATESLPLIMLSFQGVWRALQLGLTYGARNTSTNAPV
jgi:hypothetical protein